MKRLLLMLLLKLRDFLLSPIFSISMTFLGGTLGAAGWILGASLQLELAGYHSDAVSVLWCAVGVFVIGCLMWCRFLIVRTINQFVLIEVLLGASFAFGVAALWIMRNNGVVAFAVNASGKFSEAFAYAAPVTILVMMACLWLPPIRSHLQQTWRLYSLWEYQRN